MMTVQVTQVSIEVVSDSEIVNFPVMGILAEILLGSPCRGCTLQTALLGSHPPDNPVSRLLNKLGWQAHA